MQADSSEETKEAGLTLMDKLFFNGDYIENASKTLKLYTNQSMSYVHTSVLTLLLTLITKHMFSYLDSAIKFAYTLYSALEKYAKVRDDIHYQKRRAAQLVKCRWLACRLFL
jgi:hypothetical protein